MPASCGKGPGTQPTRGQEARGPEQCPHHTSVVNTAQARKQAEEHQACLQRQSTETWDTNRTEAGALLCISLGSSGNSRSWSGCRAQHSPQAMWELPVCTAGHCELVLRETMKGPSKSHCRIMSHELKYIINILGKLI